MLEAELFGIEDRAATGVRGRRGKLEAAEGGTLFLDEVSDLSLSAQAKLLRACRISQSSGSAGTTLTSSTCASSRPQPRTVGLVRRRLFRQDLFYRLSGVDVRVPTLRERRPDVLELAEYFLERHRGMRPLRISQLAADALVTYDWPGNVRELERLMERAVTLADCEVLDLDDLPPTIRGDYGAAVVPSVRRHDTLRAWTSRYARLVLERCQGNKREACRVLDISYHTLQAYLRYPSLEDGDDAFARAGGGGAIDGVRSAAHRRTQTCRASPAKRWQTRRAALAARSRVYRNRRSPTWGIRGPSGRGA
jgi:transcriptional regulator with PAS, ATPase and Fis domain